MFERDWVPSVAMARVLGIHPQTLRKLRRHQITPFKEGRDYRWVGLSTSSHRRQGRTAGYEQGQSDFLRQPASAGRSFQRLKRHHRSDDADPDEFARQHAHRPRRVCHRVRLMTG